jgi:hypothetical protein
LYQILNERLGCGFKWHGKPEEFKKFLGLKRDDTVNVFHLPQIEYYLPPEYGLEVHGDRTYISRRNTKKLIKMKLYNSHYQPFTVQSMTGSKGYEIERKPMIVGNGKYPDRKMVYDPKEERERPISINDYYRMMNNIIIIHRKPEEGTAKEQYDNFIIMADLYKEKTNGLINMYQTGTFVNTAIKYFYETNPSIYPEPIDQIEAEFIEGASIGQLIFSVDSYDGPAHQADFVSAYPSIMKDSGFHIPIKRGDIQTMRSEDFGNMTFLPIGIYRFRVTVHSPKSPISKVFKLNKNNLYTHTDFLSARELGFKMELICDGRPNACIYGAGRCIKGSELFGPFVEMMYGFKKQKMIGSKPMLNCLWGALCEKQKVTRNYQNDGKAVRIPENYDVMKVQPSIINGAKQDVITLGNIMNPYRHNYARLKPFILSKGRHRICRVMTPYADDIIRCNTDGFHSKIKLPTTYGESLGDLRYEGAGNLKLKNVNSYQFSISSEPAKPH